MSLSGFHVMMYIGGLPGLMDQNKSIKEPRLRRPAGREHFRGTEHIAGGAVDELSAVISVLAHEREKQALGDPIIVAKILCRRAVGDRDVLFPTGQRTAVGSIRAIHL